MGRRRGKESKSYTLPSSPSSSSSDFEFTISVSPRKSSTALCPADELFYKGQLLPLQLSPRISMVRTLFLSSSSTSTSTTSRDSNDSQSSFTLFPDCDSSRPSSVTEEEDEFKRLCNQTHIKRTTHKYFSLSRFSSVFRKPRDSDSDSSSLKRMSEVIRKYLKKVKPLYDKLSQKHTSTAELVDGTTTTMRTDQRERERKETSGVLSHSFSGNLRYPRRRSCVSSCPSSMRSSPSHSGVLSQSMFAAAGDASSMEELQSAIQGAIAHCKNSLIQNKTMVSNEI